MKNRIFNIILFIAIASCSSDIDPVAGDVNGSKNKYSSEAKNEFINIVLLKKCSSFKKRNIQKYSNCIKETQLSLDSINWVIFDSLEENQKNNILAPCNSAMIRNTSKFSVCINKQLIGFKDLPESMKEDLNIANRPKKEVKSSSQSDWINIFNRKNTNVNTLSGEQVFQMFEKSVFMILATNQGSNFSSQGSAVAVSGDMLFTNCHVVLDDKNNPYNIIALANDSLDKDAWFKAIVFKMSPKSDQCILKSIQKNDLQHIPIGRKTSDLRVGEQVLALGYPAAEDLNFDSNYRAPLTLSKGIISAIRDQSNISQIQTDAFIINGSSGGALLDMKGNLIGITTSGFEGTQLNFAIAADEYQSL